MTLASTRYSLLLRIADSGDHVAWLEFLAIYEPLVYSMARRRGLQDADARDLCQEVFRCVAGAVGSFDPSPERGSFRAWLFTVTKNLLSNLCRRDRSLPRPTGGSEFLQLLQSQPDGRDEQSQLIDREHEQRVLQFAAESIRREFEPTSWQAFWRTAVESRPVSEVAAELAISRGAVYIARSRILSRLKTRVTEIEGEEQP